MRHRRGNNLEEIVLGVLREIGEANINKLRKRTGLNYYTLLKILENLVLKGIIVEKRIGKLRVFTMRSAGDQRTV